VLSLPSVEQPRMPPPSSTVTAVRYLPIDRSVRWFAQTQRMKISTRKIGGIWHGYLEGHPEIDERALTEEIARQKVERILDASTKNELGEERSDDR
jgi:hypothetical protein